MRQFIPVFALSACAIVQAQTSLQYTITTIAGNNTQAFAGDGSGATSASLNLPFSIAIDSSGSLYIADQNNNRIRKVSGGNISTVAGSGTNSYSGDGKAATAASLSAPSGIAVDGSGNLYIADSSNYVIRKVTSGGTISTIAGVQNQGPGLAGDNSPATSAILSHPAGVALDSSGNIYFADPGNNEIRMITTGGTINTIAGFGNAGFAGDGGLARNARLNNPIGVAVDRAGNVYISDSGNNRIRKVSNGIITTIAGIASSGRAGDGGPASAAQLNNPRGIAVDAAGNLYIADSFSSRVRVITTNGIISTIAGNGTNGYSGDGGSATAAQLFYPTGVAIGPNGTVYVVDNQNNVIRLLTPVAGALPSISANGVSAAAAFGGGASVSPGDWIEIYGSQLATDTRTWGYNDFNGINAPTSLGGVSVTVGGQAAYVDYVSDGQVNALLPSNLGTGQQQLTITTPAGISASYQLNVNPVQPGILAPASFKVGGTQYAAALFPDGSTYVAPLGAIGGVSSRAAALGDTVTFYGIGFGAVTPATPTGQIVQQRATIVMPLSVTIGSVPAQVTYAGLVPGSVALYQFNVVIPAAASGNAVPVVFTLGGSAVTQTLAIAIGG